MRALVATGDADAPVALGDVDEPRPDPGEAVLAVEAVSLNRGECRRALAAAPGWVPGWDVAGRIVDPGRDGPPAGTRVVGLLREGGWAERVAVRADRLAPLPDEVPVTVAATLPVAGLTALLALRRGGGLLGRSVAVTGATGGVGVAALQLARGAGAHTTAVVSAPDRVDGLPEGVVDAVEVGLEEGGPPFDLVLDSVGGPLLAAALRRLAPGGRLVTYGSSSGARADVDVQDLYRRNRSAVEGFFLFDEMDADPPGGRHLATLVDLVAAGRLRMAITAERPWTDAAATVRALLDRRIPGKAVLTLS